jgi:hypothetical protein
MIDDADDAGIDWRFDRKKGEAGFFPTDEEHVLADSGAHGIDGHQWLAHGVAIRRQRLDDEKLETHEVLVLAGCDNLSDDLGQLHRFRIG